MQCLRCFYSELVSSQTANAIIIENDSRMIFDMKPYVGFSIACEIHFIIH